MEKKLKSKWVKALRSGKFTQDSPAHAWVYGGKHCCLGVLGEVLGGTNMSCLMPVFGGIGLSGDEIDAFVKLNDEGVPFEMIAGLIHEAL